MRAVGAAGVLVVLVLVAKLGLAAVVVGLSVFMVHIALWCFMLDASLEYDAHV